MAGTNRGTVKKAMGNLEEPLENNSEKEAQRIEYPLPRLLTIRQASAYLGLTVWAVRERIWSGHLPVVTFPEGKKKYLDRNDLENFIQRNKKTVV